LLLQIACHRTDCRFFDVCGDSNDLAKWEWFSPASTVIPARWLQKTLIPAFAGMTIKGTGSIAKAARQRQYLAAALPPG